MRNLLKKVLTQKNINNYYHLPKAVLANTLNGFPTNKLKVIGITGTDGKTTTTNMVYQILKDAGKKVSMVSTINAVVAGKVYDTGFHVTSPDPFTIQKFAKQAIDNGDEYLVLEVTSHALDQNRFWGIKFDIGVITNITHEHLDYHKTFDNYQNTKFKLIKNVKFAVINQNIKKIQSAGKTITFGLTKGDFNQKDLKLKLSLPGNYNIENALASLAVAFILNIDKKIAQKVLENLSQIKGRMQEVENSRGVKIIIDFAHTPNALEQVLKTLKSQTNGNLIAVFGAASKRDVLKRPIMGEKVGKEADFIIITAEDPRGESVEEISFQIAQGVEKTGKIKDKDYWVIEDREKAINFALNNLAKKGDTVGIFGKGHEDSMNLDGKKEVPWSDFKAVKKALEYGR